MLTATLLMFAGLGLPAEDSETAKKFVGEWQAKLNDKVICTIRLRAGDPISGQSENCRISIDENGDVRAPESNGEPDAVSPILNPKLDGSILRFEEQDGDDMLKLELTLTGDGKAELRIPDAPVRVKPIPFTRR